MPDNLDIQRVIRAYTNPMAEDVCFALDHIEKLVSDEGYEISDFVRLVVEGRNLHDAGLIPDSALCHSWLVRFA